MKQLIKITKNHQNSSEGVTKFAGGNPVFGSVPFGLRKSKM